MSVRITIIGSGYVGLVSGACFAELGHDVICVDKDPSKIEQLNNGIIPIYEPGLDSLVGKNAAAGRLRFSLDLGNSIKDRDAVFIAVGTPTDRNGGRADLSYVVEAAETVARHITGFTVIVTKSTVPVSTNAMLKTLFDQNVPKGARAAVVSNPEFLREGAAIDDFMEPDRIVVGADQDDAVKVMRDIYAPITAQGYPLVVTGIETAELIKYAANAFLAVKISYINEIGDLCEKVGADVQSVAMGIGLDKRIGPDFLKTGPGWGGSCFPKDTRALKSTADDIDVRLRIVDAAIESNCVRKATIAERIQAHLSGSVKGKTITVFGLTFKGETDDMRESPSVDVVNGLIELGGRVTAYDPSMPKEAATLVPKANIIQSPTLAAGEADALVILTDWNEFKSYDLAQLAQVMRDPVLIDLRNMFSEQDVMAAGFRKYESLGRVSKVVRLAQTSGGATCDTDDVSLIGLKKRADGAPA